MIPLIQQARTMPTVGATFTTKQDDLSVGANTVLRWNGTGSTGITGLTAVMNGGTVTIINASTDYLLWLENENTASSAANRVMLPDGHWAPLMSGDTITLMYDGTASRWRVVSWPTRGMGMGLSTFTDADGATLHYAYLSGTGAVMGPNTAASWSLGNRREQGVTYIATGTTAAGAAAIGYTTNHQINAGRGCAMTVTRMTVVSALTDGTETYSVYTGFLGSVLTPTNAVCWEYRWNGSAAELNRMTGVASAFNRASSGNPSIALSTPVTLVVFCNADWTRADFLYSTGGIAYTLAGSETANMPGAGVNLGLVNLAIAKSAGLTSRAAVSDYYGNRVIASRA